MIWPTAKSYFVTAKYIINANLQMSLVFDDLILYIQIIHSLLTKETRIAGTRNNMITICIIIVVRLNFFKDTISLF